MVGLQSLSLLSVLVVSAIGLVSSTNALPSAPQQQQAAAAPAARDGTNAPTVVVSKRQQQNGRFVTTGVTSGSVEVRRNIRDLQNKYPDQFNVMVLGLARMQQRNQTDMISYFQLAGIHGVPASDWGGVTGSSQKQGPGWCTHVSNLFVTWHRPYIALFEQVLVSSAQEAAQEFPSGQERDKYTAAASQLRLPYMDWAADPPPGENVLPSVFTQPTIQVVTRNGSTNMTNPLYSYKFNPIDPGLFFQPFIFWPETLRWPTTPDRDAQTQTQRLLDQINGNQPQMKERVYFLLTASSNFTQAGTYAWMPEEGPISYDSFESMHDHMHGVIGGSNFGDMGIIPVSSFDPVFWFHHAMIDRSFAMWQAIYPDSYVEPMAQKQGAYWYNQGDTFNISTPLKPFYSDANGTFWTSETARSTRAFGYTYPELQTSNQSAVRAAVNSQYGPFTGQFADPAPGPKRFSSFLRARAGAARSFRDFASRISGLTFRSTSAANPRYYQLNYRAPKNTVNSSFYIDFFLGKPTSEDPKSWLDDANHIGSQAILSMDRAGDEEVTVTGVLPLNRKLERLVQIGRLTDVAEDAVVTLLKNKIAWRVRSTDYSPIPLAQIPDFQVSFASIEYEPAKGPSDFPKYLGDWTIYESVTAGKPGGLDDATDI